MQGVAEKREVDVRVARALDRSAPLTARVEAYQSLFALKAEERDAGLRQLLSQGDEQFATMAASELIRRRIANIGPVVEQQILKWSESGQARVIEAVAERRDDQLLLNIPRIVLTAELIQSTNAKPADNKTNVWLLAALILTKSDLATDHELVRKLITQNPKSSGSWLLMLISRQSGESEIALADSTYRDPKVALPARVLAAAVAAKKEKAAGEFALSEIAKFISHYRDQDIWVLLNNAYATKPGKKEYLDLREQLIFVSILQYVETEGAERLTMEALGSTNLLIRVAAGLAAAIQWPSKLLQVGQGKFSDDEYLKILAFMSLRHPQLAGEIMQKKLDKKSFGEALRRLRTHGPASVFPIGTVLFGY